ncbi:nitrous oxide reductase accessory protein NosL [Leisingera sp. MMG026]|uniref:nitrous oxide reductase accessory protein NosL n=1 Tax=Leisingera sp. MMG026 TaxID=2909982 RepID=UPI001F320F52|nr:nitrous oxide reductase accessory protein NosL [Leisingera sp. MMG026]MCF6430932.1 nitrous oxide reductase accessory protein NosL [Leisingera sp. MMG026]
MRHLILAAALVLSACQEEEAKAPPAPVELTEVALSYFCQMNVSEHGGPKGQIHLDGFPVPLFFAQVRDLAAYVKSPERDAEITAIYVSDMGAAPSWAHPGTMNWIDAKGAHFVVGSNVAGGMGAPEVVPFATPEDAARFTERYGGTVAGFNSIPDDAVLGPVDLDRQLETPS